MKRRFLIVNADDFGQSPAVNRGIIEAHRKGIVTSTSLMVRHKAAPDAVALSRDYQNLSIGLHFDLGEWRLHNADWIPVYQVLQMDDVRAVAEEAERQLTAFRQLVGHHPTHIDSHQHVHLREPVRSILVDYAAELGVPLRRCNPEITFCGDFYGQDSDGSPLPDQISAETLIGILANLLPGITELSCHPALGNDLDTMYSAARASELKVLCQPPIWDAITRENITLCSFHDIAAAKRCFLTE
jgi:predicted glycoside hydrolase/deacetylase ChbG (UPF0249 family)